ncbi:MAG: rubrerythrin [Nitrospinae bacterium]|nr:rubrerythrin [Nitrospinota bacterium]
MGDKSKRPVEELLLDILEEAIEEEKSSRARYLRGYELAVDEEAKKMFQRLAQDEEAHEHVLKERYYQIKKRLGLKVMKDL